MGTSIGGAFIDSADDAQTRLRAPRTAIEKADRRAKLASRRLSTSRKKHTRGRVKP
jgi:hypothetical protein